MNIKLFRARGGKAAPSDHGGSGETAFAAFLRDNDPAAVIGEARAERVIAAVAGRLSGAHRDRGRFAWVHPRAWSMEASVVPPFGWRWAPVFVVAAVLGGIAGSYTAEHVEGWARGDAIALFMSSADNSLSAWQ